MEVLRGPAAETEIKGMLSKESQISVAVAYWGKGAIERLGLGSFRGQKFRVICNMRNGGCNPDEIRALIKLFGPDAVMTNDRLHAKVWLSERLAIVGSSNASTNGYGLEGEEAAGLIEMNVRVTTQTDLRELKRWFDKEVASGTRPITESDLHAAKQLHDQIRVGRPFSGSSLLQVANDHPSSLEDRSVFVWFRKHQDLSPWANARLTDEQESRNDSKIECYEDVANGNGYMPGSYILDFDVSAPQSPIFTSWQILSDKPFILNKSKRKSILLCRPVKKVHGLKLGPKKLWLQAAKRAISSPQEEWTLSEFFAHYMRP